MALAIGRAPCLLRLAISIGEARSQWLALGFMRSRRKTLGQLVPVVFNCRVKESIILKEFLKAGVTVFLGKVKGLVEEVRLVDNTVREFKGGSVNLYAVIQETLVGTTCGKGRKVYQMGSDG
jgi:hypothetical protein